jgi:hypothetical protein
MVHGRSAAVISRSAPGSARSVPLEILRQDAVFRRVVAQREEQRVRHVRLEAQRLRAVHQFQKLHHAPPAMHAAPADLAFRRQPLAKAAATSQASRNVCAIRRVLPSGSLAHSAGLAAESMRTIPYGRAPNSRSLRAIRQALRTCARNAAARPRCPWPSRRRWAARPAPPPIPPPGPARALCRPAAPDRRRSHRSSMRVEEEQIHAIEPRAVHLGGGGQAQHGVQIDGRLGIRAFAHQAGPHGVVDAGKVRVRTRHTHDAPY